MSCLVDPFIDLSKSVSFLPLTSGGYDDDDASDAKRSKSDSPASAFTGTPPATALTPGLAPGLAPAAAGLPGVMPGIPRPPFGVMPG